MIRVLYIDDDSLLLDTCKRSVEVPGEIAVDTARSGAEAEVAMERKDYDVIVSDYQMPSTNGIRLLKDVRAKYGHLPFILFTGKGSEEVAMEALNSGADLYLKKGSDPTVQYGQLKKAILQLAKRHGTERSGSITQQTQAKPSEGKLKRSLSLLKAAFDSCEEGMLVTGLDQNITEYNQRFLEMWKVPPGFTILGEKTALLSHLGDQLSSPDLFYSFIDDVYAHPTEEKRLTVEFTNGDKYEALTKPIMLGTVAEGRFWSFRDVTQQSKRETDFKAREENLLGLFEDNKANMMLIDPASGEIVYANRAACSYYGYERSLFLKKNIADINILEAESVAKELHQAIAGKKQYFIFQHRLASGEVRDVEVFSGPIQFEERNLLFSLVHDISEMKRTKRLAEESELRHNRILNNLAVGILVSDVNGKLIYSNKHAQNLLRWKPEELIGRSPMDLVVEEEREIAKNNYSSRTKGEQGEVDYRFVRGDGTAVWDQVTAVPLFDHWVYGGTIATVVDISERRRDAELIRESEKKFRDIFNNMHDAVMIHEPGGVFIEVNDLACQRFGYTREEMLRMRPEDLDAPDETADIPVKQKILMENGSAIFESTHVTKDGSRIPTEINATLIGFKGKPTVLVVCRDITERKISDERLTRANEKLMILNSITRHDILNQLMVLKANLDLAIVKEKDPTLIERLDKIGRSADIINSQLMFAKDYQEMGTSSPRWQNIGQIMAQLPDIKEITKLELDDRLEDLKVYADPMLGKVFHNIVEDTVKYAERPLQVKISFRKEKRSLVMVYEDRGPGIPRNEKEKIFEMGFGQGTGLGLHLSREILSITDIGIKETGEPGKGVRFEIEVPEGKFRFNKLPDH